MPSSKKPRFVAGNARVETARAFLIRCEGWRCVGGAVHAIDSGRRVLIGMDLYADTDRLTPVVRASTNSGAEARRAKSLLLPTVPAAARGRKSPARFVRDVGECSHDLLQRFGEAAALVLGQ